MAETTTPKSFTGKVVDFCLRQRLVVILVTLMVIGWGLMTAPFDWNLGIKRSPVPVDAIPDIGENQQIVFTEWRGRSPQDVEDQVSYPLTVALLGIPGVKTVRTFSMLGFSTIYIIFEEDIEFYWSRTRILEKLSSLSPGTLPTDARPALGPDATALGQVFWYTLEGRDPEGKPAGGWDPDELRSIQDWYVRYSLLAAGGVSEVASVGGFVREYQVDADPDALRAFSISLEQLLGAVKMSNLDVGARTIEINRVEYVIRGVGFVKKIADLENAVITVREGAPVRVKDVARITQGPALRRGALDKGGAEAVGGVVVVRYGENPLATIQNVKSKISEISPGLPSRTLPNGTVSKVTIVPFYDRSNLISETLGTLNTALTEEILVTIIVILIALMNLRSSFLVSALLPLAVLMCFIGMRVFKVDANIVALSGIAIAIGTIVDMGIIITENIFKHLETADPREERISIIYRATMEVGSAVLTAVSTTVIGFMPVFAMEGAEGKLFKPLAYTKTFALAASIIVALTILPTLAAIFLRMKCKKTYGIRSWLRPALLIFAAVFAYWYYNWWSGAVLTWVALRTATRENIPARAVSWIERIENWAAIAAFIFILSEHWLPLGPEPGSTRNFIFAAVLIVGLMALLQIFQALYPRMLGWFLAHKIIFLTMPTIVLVMGAFVWLGAPAFTSRLPSYIRSLGPMVYLNHLFPGLGKEFMPPLDEGSYLYMPTTMPHASIGEVQEILAMQDMAITAIPEVESAVGKLGRAESPLDPAPVSMIETVINYHSEYLTDKKGRRLTFSFDSGKEDLFRNIPGEPVTALDGLPYKVRGAYRRDTQSRLIADPDGKPFRIWRTALHPELNPGREYWQGIRSPRDIWDEIVRAAEVPGVTGAPMLQPIAARIVMLQSGMRAPMGIKIKGPDLNTIEKVGLEIEALLKKVPSVEPATVIADRIVGKPYLEIVIDREAIARYGIMINQLQEVLEAAIGGRTATVTVEGRERYGVLVRYQRELRDNLEAIRRIFIASPVTGSQIPLEQLADIRYVRGPQAIKSEDTFLVGYVLFDKRSGYAEVDVVEQASRFLEERISSGELVLPAGVSYRFAGNYENQVRAQQRLTVILPLALLLIFLVLYLQFRSVATTMMIFSGIFVAWGGGFIMIWLYAQPWFLNFSVFGVSMQGLFQVHPINLSVAIWVGFLALFGIASDDGVLMATYLDSAGSKMKSSSREDIRKAIVEGATRRIRPAAMTSATTILALIPVLTSSGRGADIMVPMAIPSFGGMVFAMLTWFVVPVLYDFVAQLRLHHSD